MYLQTKKNNNSKLQDFLFEEFWNYLKGNLINPNSIEQGLQKILDNVRYNHDCFDCYELDQIKSIVFAYGNLVMNGTINEYNRAERPQEIKSIELIVQSKCLEEQLLVNTVLWTLYWSTLDGQVIVKDLAFPLTESKINAYKNIPEIYKNKSVGEQLANFSSDTLKTLAWVGGGIVVTVLAVELLPLFNK
jgi:hypothetical protein